jgi:DNA-binding MarR family transcriptional regulator
VTTDTESPALDVELRQAVGRVYRRFRALRAPGELGDGALEVLKRLRREGPLSLGRLADEARVTPASMSQTVNRLAAGGFITRAADPDDGRRVLFHLTEDGRRIENATLARGRAWFADAVAACTSEERAVLAEAAVLLDRIAGTVLD